jgi:hypothetical protein
MHKNPKRILGLHTQTENPWLMHKNSTPNLARNVGEVAVTDTHAHTNIHIQKENMHISTVLETSSVFKMQVSVTDANIFSVNGKEL